MAWGLYTNPRLAANQLPELTADTTYMDWINKESFPLAKTSAYLNGTVTGNKAHPSALPANYAVNTLLAIAQKRIVLAGIRLGQTLTALVH